MSYLNKILFIFMIALNGNVFAAEIESSNSGSESTISAPQTAASYFSNIMNPTFSLIKLHASTEEIKNSSELKSKDCLEYVLKHRDEFLNEFNKHQKLNNLALFVRKIEDLVQFKTFGLVDLIVRSKNHAFFDIFVDDFLQSQTYPDAKCYCGLLIILRAFALHTNDNSDTVSHIANKATELLGEIDQKYINDIYTETAIAPFRDKVGASTDRAQYLTTERANFFKGFKETDLVIQFGIVPSNEIIQSVSDIGHTDGSFSNGESRNIAHGYAKPTSKKYR